MSNLDLFILIVLLFAALRGFYKGFILELFSLAGTILSLLFGMTVVHLLMPVLDKVFHHSVWTPLIAYLFAFSGIYLVVIILGRMVETGVRTLQLGPLNRIFGAVAGILKSALLISFILWIGLRFGLIDAHYPETSHIYPLIGWMAPHFIAWLKSIFPDILHSFPQHTA